MSRIASSHPTRGLQSDTSVVLDWTYRYIHTASGAPCTTRSGGIDKTPCPDQATCSRNFLNEGVDYTAAGITTIVSTLTTRQ